MYLRFLRGKPRHLREGMTQIRGEAVYDLRAPSFIALPPQNVVPDLPI